MYIERIETYLEQKSISGDMDDWAETRADLLPLEFYKTGSVIYIASEKAAYVVRRRKRTVYVPDENRGDTTAKTEMTEAEIIRAATLLEKEDRAELNRIVFGRWAVASERGLYGVYDTKNMAVDTALSNHCQLRKFAKVKRHRKGVYSLSILDCDEDLSEHFYHEFTLERVTAENILHFKELFLSGVLPDWFFDPYSAEYKEYNARTTNGEG